MRTGREDSTIEAQENQEEQNSAAASTPHQDDTTTAVKSVENAAPAVSEELRVCFDSVALELCARRVAAESGDVRKSLEACRLAAQAAIQQVLSYTTFSV